MNIEITTWKVSLQSDPQFIQWIINKTNEDFYKFCEMFPIRPKLLAAMNESSVGATKNKPSADSTSNEPSLDATGNERSVDFITDNTYLRESIEFYLEWFEVNKEAIGQKSRSNDTKYFDTKELRPPLEYMRWQEVRQDYRAVARRILYNLHDLWLSNIQMDVRQESSGNIRPIPLEVRKVVVGVHRYLTRWLAASMTTDTSECPAVGKWPDLERSDQSTKEKSSNQQRVRAAFWKLFVLRATEVGEHLSAVEKVLFVRAGGSDLKSLFDDTRDEKRRMSNTLRAFSKINDDFLDVMWSEIRSHRGR